MATTRLRKTFHYPTESDSDDASDLDEEHQEALLTTLAATDESTNLFYRRAFLPLPLLSTVLYIFPVFSLRTHPRTRLLALLALTNLVASAYILHELPVRGVDRKGKRPVHKGDPRGPVERYITLLNAVLSAVLMLAAVGAYKRGLVDEFCRGVLPGAVFLIVVFARSQMAPVDIEGLERLKYNYKGA